MAADKLIQLVNGKLTQVQATVTSAGAANDGDVVALDSAGKLDISVLPTGLGPDVALIVASENLAAGSYINIYNNAGTVNVRLADNSNSRDAHGFVKTSVTSGNNATVYFEGDNDDLSSLTIGARYYLSTAGAATATAPVSPAAQISQFLGIAINATTINTDIDDCVVLA
jgi:hypothetical protein